MPETTKLTKLLNSKMVRIRILCLLALLLRSINARCSTSCTWSIHMERVKKEGAFQLEVFLSHCYVRQKRESAFQA